MISRHAAPISSRDADIRAVGDVAGHAHDMLGPGAVLGEDRERVAQRLRELAVERIFGEAFMLVPADDAGGEDHPPARG